MSAPNPQSRTILFWAAAGGIFVFGIVLAILGALFGLPEMRERLDINLAQQGNIFLFLFFGVFVSTVFAGPAIDSVGNKLVLTLSSALVATGLILFASAESFFPALAAAFVLGVGGGGLNTSTNALVSDLFPEKRGAMLNLLGVFFGFGALFIPLLAALILGVVGPVQLLWIATGLAILCLVVYLLLPFPAPKGASTFAPLGILRAAGHPGVLLLAAILFCQSGNEASVGGWTSTYLGSMGATPRTATWILAAYWASMMLGRVLSAFLLERMSKQSLVLASALGSAAGAAVLLGSASLPLMAAGAVLVGVSYAGIYPTTLAIAGDRNPREVGTVFGLLFAVGLLGGMTFPWALGQISQVWGVRSGMVLPLLGALAIAVLIVAIGWRSATAQVPAGHR